MRPSAESSLCAWRVRKIFLRRMCELLKHTRICDLRKPAQFRAMMVEPTLIVLTYLGTQI